MSSSVFDALRGPVQSYGRRSARPAGAAASSPLASFSSSPSSSVQSAASVRPAAIKASTVGEFSSSLPLPSTGPRTRSRSRSPSPPKLRTSAPPAEPQHGRAMPSSSMAVADMNVDGASAGDNFVQTSLPAAVPARGTKRKQQQSSAQQPAVLRAASPAPSTAAESPPRSVKRPTAATRKQSAAAEAAAAKAVFDVFSIDTIDDDDRPAGRTAAPIRSAALLAQPMAKATGTLGPRRRVAVDGGSTRDPAARKRSPARSPPASTSRVVRTWSSPAKLSTMDKRRQDEAKDADSGEATELDGLHLRDPVRAKTSVIAPYRPPPSSSAKRTLSAVAGGASKAAAKPLQVSRSNPLPSPFAFTGHDPIAASSLHFSTSLTGADRQLMEQLQYLLDGCSASSSTVVRQSSAVKVAQAFSQKHRSRTQWGDGNHLFFLMRAHGGFEQLCRVFAGCVDDPILSEAFVACAYLMSKEQSNAQCVTADGVESLLDVIWGSRRAKRDEAKEAKAESDDREDIDDALQVTRIRSIRSKSTGQNRSTTPAGALRALLEDEALFARTRLPYSVSLLALVSLLSFSADAHFKETVSRVTPSFGTLTSLIHRTFLDLVTASRSQSPVASPSPSAALRFRLQALLTILENLTHTHRDNQRLLLEARVEPMTEGMAEPSILAFTMTTFPQLYFAMLQWCTHRVVYKLDPVEEAEAKRNELAAAAVDDGVDVDDRAHVVLTTPTYTSLALLLCRLLVNLTNKSERGCQILYYPYPDPTRSCASSSGPVARKTGVQIMADLVALCWYHPHLRSLPASPSEPCVDGLTLNAESDVFDVLTLSIGVMINTAEQSAVIREVLLENCHVTVHRRLDGTLVSIIPDNAAESSPFSLHALESTAVAWIDILVDIFVRTHLALTALEQQIAAEKKRPSQPAAPVVTAAPQRYGSRALSAPPIVPADVPAEMEVEREPAPSSTVEHACLVHRMVSSYSGMVIAVLAVHDALAFSKVQAALRGREENAHVTHRASRAASTDKRKDDILYDASPVLSPPPATKREESGGTGAGSVIFSLRLVVRVLNEFLLLQHGSEMSDESVQSMVQLIAHLEHRIKADSAFGM